MKGNRKEEMLTEMWEAGDKEDISTIISIQQCKLERE